jgi:hypothetical protein
VLVNLKLDIWESKDIYHGELYHYFHMAANEESDRQTDSDFKGEDRRLRKESPASKTCSLAGANRSSYGRTL